MRKELITSAIALVFCTMSSSMALSAQASRELTLTEAVTGAIRTSPEYGMADHEKKAAMEQLSEARSRYLPSLDFQAQGGRARTSSPVIARTQTLWEHNGSLTLTQLLFDGWGTQSGVKSGEYRVESASHHVREASEFLGLDVVQAYLDILRQRSLLALARANVDDHLDIYKKVKAGGDAGTTVEGDVVQAGARVNNARADLLSVERDLRNAESLFVQKAGEMPGDLEDPPIPRDVLPATAAEAISAALMHNPTLAVHESDIESAQAEYEGTDSAFFPKIDLELNGSQGENQSGISGSQNSFSAQAVMRWNLSRGGADVERRRELMYRHAAAKDRAAIALRQVEKDIRDTWAARDFAARRMEEFRRQAESNKKVVGVYMDQFVMNRRTLLDVLNAQNEFFSANANYINALYTEDFAVFRLLALEGKMLSVLGIEPFREAKLEAR